MIELPFCSMVRFALKVEELNLFITVSKLCEYKLIWINKKIKRFWNFIKKSREALLPLSN